MLLLDIRGWMYWNRTRSGCTSQLYLRPLHEANFLKFQFTACFDRSIKLIKLLPGGNMNRRNLPVQIVSHLGNLFSVNVHLRSRAFCQKDNDSHVKSEFFDF